jgi:NlpC/P60 family putative phage cell wall peptidase
VPATRAEVVAQARTWVGTRWQHQGRIKGVAVDCAGLIIGVARELGLADAQVDGYSPLPDGMTLQRYCAQYMQPIRLDEAQPGDVVTMAWDRHPQHIGILTDVGLIHSYAHGRGVVEHALDREWRLRLRGAYRMPGVTE